MKLNIVTPRTGFVWVRLGIRTFWKQPLAMSGLFFLFMPLDDPRKRHQRIGHLDLN